MTAGAVIHRFPPRRTHAIFICQERDGSGWLAIAGAHGWLCGSHSDALETAQWLAANLNFAIRETTP